MARRTEPCRAVCSVYLLLVLTNFVAVAENRKASAAVGSQPDVDKLENSLKALQISSNNPVRKGKAAIKYINDLLSKLTPGAREKDSNLIMTGESCANGLGSVYNV